MQRFTTTPMIESVQRERSKNHIKYFNVNGSYIIFVALTKPEHFDLSYNYQMK